MVNMERKYKFVHEIKRIKVKPLIKKINNAKLVKQIKVKSNNFLSPEITSLDMTFQGCHKE